MEKLLAIETLAERDIFWMWDGEKVVTDNTGWMDAKEAYALSDSMKSLPRASAEDIAAAAEWYRVNKKEVPSCRVSGNYSYIGCEVIVHKSRKVKNGEAYEVVNYRPAGFDERFGNRIAAQVVVKTENGNVAISATCIKEVIKGAAPFWG